MAVYRDKRGNKLYPVCSWERNQHKLYNAHDRVVVARVRALEEKDYEELEKLADAQDKIERAMSIFDRYVIDGVVYATYQDGLLIKNYVWAYNARH